jgi:acyl-CoA synthetase (AMP-forming)/AMP-acid ligase II
VRVGEEHRRSIGAHGCRPRLVIMPLFHIHGLIAALLAPLSVAGRCTARRASMRSSSSAGWTR